MHTLPAANHPARAMFDIADIVAIGTGERAVPVRHVAVRQAREYLAREKTAKAVCSIVLEHDDNISLVRIGARGGVKRIWVFGKANARTVVA